MKTVLTAAVLSTLGLGLGVGMAQATPHQDMATVVSSTPVYERVATPRRECYTEQVAGYEERHVRRAYQDVYSEPPRAGIGAGTVLGAIIGGAIGHQFGNSSGGRDRGTAAGAVIGGLIGNDIERNGGGYDARYDGGYRRAAYDVERVPVTRDVQRCNVVNDYRDVVSGYDVRYRYNGREYSTRMSYDPGPTMPINVDVRPSPRTPMPTYDRY